MRLEFEPRVTTPPVSENKTHGTGFAVDSLDFDSLLKKGVAFAQSGDRDQARRLLSQATAINPASEDAWIWLASISDYPEELLAFLNRVLEINPDNDKAIEWQSATNALLAKTFVQRAVAARHDGSSDLANQFVEQALAHDSQCETAWFWKASLSESEEQKLAFFARVIDINPANSDALEAIAGIKHAQVSRSLGEANEHASNGRRDAAMAILNELIEHDSAAIRESAWLMMCSIAESEDQRLEFLNRVLAENPGNRKAADDIESIVRSRSKAAFEDAKSAAAEGDRAKAVEILDGFLKDVPHSVNAWLLKSHLSRGLDQKVEALEKALEIDPENCAARSGLAFLALTFGSNSDSKVAPPAEIIDAEVIGAEDELFTPEFQVATEPEVVALDQNLVFEEELTTDRPKSFDAIRTQEQSFDLPSPSEPAHSIEHIFDPFKEKDDPTSTTMDILSPFVQEAVMDNSFTDAPPASPFDQIVEEPVAAAETQIDDPETGTFYVDDHAQPANLCPFCASSNDPQALDCATCNATLTLSDIEKLLAGTDAHKESVQRAVTEMEADWNSREFSEDEFTALGLGHFNLGNTESGFRYLQEASRINPDNVILAGQVNTIAIRLDEMRRRHATYDAIPKGKRILVVDDSPTVRKLISGKLEKSGHVVVCAVDGVDALARLDEGMPDLVLLDITMPKMDGYEVCKQIRANPAGKNLPVVMISGKDGFFDKVRGRMAGTSGYVTKPFGPETLMKALEVYLLPDEVELS